MLVFPAGRLSLFVLTKANGIGGKRAETDDGENRQTYDQVFGFFPRLGNVSPCKSKRVGGGLVYEG